MVCTYLVVTRKMKLDHDFVGPHDAVRLVADYGGKYKVLVYKRIFSGCLRTGTPIQTHNFKLYLCLFSV